jgi:hypothetical protein
MHKKQQAIVIALILAGLTGCGVYSFSPGGKSSIKTIAVNQFENETIEVGLSSTMTDLVINAFIADGSLKVVSENQADAVLQGTLSSYAREPHTFDASDNVSRYAVRIIFNITLKKGGGSDEELWKQAFTSEGIYLADEETEEDGQSRAAQKLVVDIINRTTKNW